MKKNNKDVGIIKQKPSQNNNEVDEEDKTILDKALSEGNYELCKLLIVNSAKISSKQLRDAVMNQDLELCTILVTANNIDEIINAVDSTNKTFLNEAADSNNTKICDTYLRWR